MSVVVCSHSKDGAVQMCTPGVYIFSACLQPRSGPLRQRQLLATPFTAELGVATRYPTSGLIPISGAVQEVKVEGKPGEVGSTGS